MELSIPLRCNLRYQCRRQARPEKELSIPLRCNLRPFLYLVLSNTTVTFYTTEVQFTVPSPVARCLRVTPFYTTEVQFTARV